MAIVSKKKLLVGIGVVLLLGAAAGAGFWLQQMQSKNNAGQQTAQNSLPSSVSKTEDLIAAGKTDEANKQINDAINDPSTSKQEKYLLYSQQGSIAIDKKDYNAGLDAYLKAEQVDPTYEISSKIGSLYQLMGNNPKAIEYYKKAISRNTDSPTRESDNMQLEQMIRNLGGQP